MAIGYESRNKRPFLSATNVNARPRAPKGNYATQTKPRPKTIKLNTGRVKGLEPIGNTPSALDKNERLRQIAVNCRARKTEKRTSLVFEYNSARWWGKYGKCAPRASQKEYFPLK